MNYTMVLGGYYMAKVEQCPSFETFGADVKAAREKLGMSRRELAEKIGVDPRYLANIELKATIPSMPLMVQLFHLCNLPAEKYFSPKLRQKETEQCQRVKYKVQLCPEKYLPAIESAIDELSWISKKPFLVCEETASFFLFLLCPRKRAFFVVSGVVLMRG